MNIISSKRTILFLCIVFSFVGFWHYGSEYILSDQHDKAPLLEKPTEKEEKDKRAQRIQSKIDRSEYYFRLLRDPETNRIPQDVRAKELSYSSTLPSRSTVKMKLKGRETSGFEWRQAGPFDVGGRTRALALDMRDPAHVIAGGASGGIWRSENDGTDWTFAIETNQNHSVTYLTQDPTSPDTWYYVSGELAGNTAADRGFKAPYFGTGIYRSTDNGATWSQINSTSDEDNTWNSPFDFITRVVVSPVTGSVFTANNGFGVFRATDGQNFSLVQGGAGSHYFSEVAVAPDGTLVAVLSSIDAGNTNNNPGVFVSTDDGETWADVTPSTFPGRHQRSVAAFAPSDPNIIYILTYVDGEGENEDVRFHYLNLDTGVSEDRSDNLPDFGGDVGYMSTQSNYNMVVAVKPDDPDFVLVGGINLFRSRNGFATSPVGGYDNNNQAQKNEYWIGGYDNENDISNYPNQHPDQHVIFFDPTDPSRVWVGHDGGLSVTGDITASRVTWTDKNNGYITTQFYSAFISNDPDDDRIVGGTQDNGTLFFRNNSDAGQSAQTEDISSGDGGYAFITDNHFFVSRQRGSIIRYNTNLSGNPATPYAFVHPAGAEDQLFIHPYAVDPTNESIMYYPSDSTIWRNTRVNLITNQDSDGAGLTSGWEELSNISAPSGYAISALTVSTNPSNILYYGASSNNRKPRLYRLMNANTATSGQENISIDGAANGAYVHDIALNPNNSDEMLVVLSNYNIESVWHTLNGGATWTAVEGNLSGNPPNNYGPSVRSATIIPSAGGTIYAVGTSTGLYSTAELDGSATQWIHESPEEIGYAVTEYISSRSSDGTLVAGTHGRGIFLGDFTGIAVGPEPAERFALNPNFPNPASSITNISFDLPARSRITITLYDIQGRKVADVLSGEERPAFKGLVEAVNLQELNLASGVYLYRFEAEPLEGGYVGKFWDTGKITYVK